MKTILVPTDFSSYGTNAIEAAASLADKMHARILLHHNVATLVGYAHMSDEEHESPEKNEAKRISSDNRLNVLRAGHRLRHLNVSKIVTHGITYQTIVEQAIKTDADLIVIGSHGNEQFDKFFIGSNIQKVMRESTCPVMTINGDCSECAWSNVVVPLSLDEDISRPFDKIREIIIELGATVQLLYVNTPGGFKNEKVIRSQMMNFVDTYPDLKFKTAIYNNRDIESGILEYCQDADVDWIAMVTHNRKHKDKYLIGVAETVAFRTNIPLLTVTIEHWGQLPD